MFNPLYLFEARLFEPMVQKGFRYFVLQSYPRGGGLLLLHHQDKGLALGHYDTLKHDPARKLYDWNEIEDQQELRNLVNTEKVFAFLKIPDAEKVAKKVLEKKVRAYIATNTAWKPKRDEETDFDIDFIYGDVYVVLKYNTQKIKVKLDQLEKF